MLAIGQLAEEVAVLESQLAAAELVHCERQADMVKQRNRARMIKVGRVRPQTQYALPPTALSAPCSASSLGTTVQLRGAGRQRPVLELCPH